MSDIHAGKQKTMGMGARVKRFAAWIAPNAVVVGGKPGGARAVALTFDDGPHPEITPRILDVLDGHPARATFFLQGDAAERNRHLVRELIRRGHQIGNHGYAHLDARYVHSEAYVSDVLRCQSVLEDITGTGQPRNFRPPFGRVAVRSTLKLLSKNFRFVFWSIDSKDSFLADANSLVAQVESQLVPPGSILLFHDDYAHTADALPRILADFRQRDLHLALIDELGLRVRMPHSVSGIN